MMKRQSKKNQAGKLEMSQAVIPRPSRCSLCSKTLLPGDAAAFWLLFSLLSSVTAMKLYVVLGELWML